MAKQNLERSNMKNCAPIPIQRLAEILNPSVRRPLRLCLILAALFAVTFPGQAQFNAIVDPSQKWLGYISIYDTNEVFVRSMASPTANIRAVFVPTPASATRLLLGMNTNTYALDGTNDLADGTPNRHLDADVYVDTGMTYGGQTVTFSGTVESNSLPASVEAYAFVKEFTPPNYGFVGNSRVPLVAGTPFTISRPIADGNICQYGFYLYGPNAAPGSANARQAVSVLVAKPGASASSGQK
jgi:hypothetical protein